MACAKWGQAGRPMPSHKVERGVLVGVLPGLDRGLDSGFEGVQAQGGFIGQLAIHAVEHAPVVGGGGHAVVDVECPGQGRDGVVGGAMNPRRTQVQGDALRGGGAGGGVGSPGVRSPEPPAVAVRARFQHGDLVVFLAQFACGGQAGDACADDQHAGCGCSL